MKKLLLLAGLLSTLTGYAINTDKIKDIFTSDEFTYAQKAEAINYMTEELENAYQQIINDDIRF